MSTSVPDGDAEFVYLSISFVKVRGSHAEEIVKAAVEAAGTVSYSVFYDTPKDDEPEPAAKEAPKDDGVVVASSRAQGGYLPEGVVPQRR